MGLTVGLVKKAFSKTKSFGSGRYANERNGNCIDKGTWKLSKLNFCGDYPDSVPLEEEEKEEEVGGGGGIASVDSSGATLGDASAAVIVGESNEEFHQDNTAPITIPPLPHQQQPSNYQPNHSAAAEEENAAAITIQSAFRGFLTRHRCKLPVGSQIIPPGRTSSSGEEFMCASPKIQPGDHAPVKAFMFQAESNSVSVQHKVRHNKQRTQISHLKEWDDSTLSSNMSKLRIQNKLEAITRRERALAYAFSQQLRSCSTKKRPTHCESNETNLGWSLLERWMATRLPENSSVEDYMEKKNAEKRRSTTLFKKQVLDVAAEEKESCGSNDFSSVIIENYTVPARSRGKEKATKKSGTC